MPGGRGWKRTPGRENGYSCEEIGKVLGITGTHVRNIERDAMFKVEAGLKRLGWTQEEIQSWLARDRPGWLP